MVSPLTRATTSGSFSGTGLTSGVGAAGAALSEDAAVPGEAGAAAGALAGVLAAAGEADVAGGVEPFEQAPRQRTRTNGRTRLTATPRNREAGIMNRES
jgi:hypothetical protein